MIPAARLLEAWDQGQSATSVPARALALLALDDPDVDPASLALGEANSRLLRLREELFGPALTCLAECPACDERLELGFSVRDLLAPGEAAPQQVTVEVEGQRHRFRLPTWVDVAATTRPTWGEDPAHLLLERCFLPEAGETTSDLPLTGALREAAAAALEAADPLSELLIAVGCAHCEEEFEARFEIVEYLWAEVDLRARRLLGEVHALASAYGWSEAEVLALSPARRRAYLEMAVGK